MEGGGSGKVVKGEVTKKDGGRVRFDEREGEQNTLERGVIKGQGSKVR